MWCECVFSLCQNSFIKGPLAPSRHVFLRLLWSPELKPWTCFATAMSPRGSGSFQEWCSLSMLAIGIDFSYPSWTCTLVKNSTCLTFLSFWSGCSIKRVLPNTLDVQAQFLQWLSLATKGGPHARVPRTFSLSVGKLGNQGKGVQTYLLGLGYRESKVFSSLGFVLNTKKTLWQTPSLNLLVSNLAARPWMALWFPDGIIGCRTVAKLETFSKVGYMCRCETLQALTSPTKYWSSWSGSSWQAWSYMVKTTEMSGKILKTSLCECCDMKGNLDTPYEITFFIFW